LIAVAAEHGFSLYTAAGTILRGWAKVKDGALAEGIALLRRGSTTYRATGQEAWLPYFIALHATACEIAGLVQESLARVEEALQIAERTGERWLTAELNRLNGQFLLRQGDTEAPEKCYRKALQIAREQEAKLWELRAAASLARLRRDHGHPVEARDLLA